MPIITVISIFSRNFTENQHFIGQSTIKVPQLDVALDSSRLSLRYSFKYSYTLKNKGYSCLPSLLQIVIF